jgi:hypothetical protein
MRKIKESESSKYIAVLAPNPEWGDYFDVEWKLCDNEEAAKEWLNSQIEGTFNFEEQCMYDLYESEEGGEYCDLVECDSDAKFFSVECNSDQVVYEASKAEKLKYWLDRWGAEYIDDDDYGECWSDSDDLFLTIWNINTHEDVTSMEQFNESSRNARHSSLREHSRNDKVLFQATENAFPAYTEPFFDHVNRDWFDGGLPFDVELNKEDRENNWKGLFQGKIRDILFIADEAEIDPQEELIFYDEDGNVIHDAYALLYDTDEVFNESSRKTRRSLKENYQDFDYAYYKTKRIANSLCKEFDCETVKYAFGRVSDEL